MFYYLSMSSTSPSRSWDDAEQAPFPSAEEVAFGAAMARCDSACWSGGSPMLPSMKPS